MTDVPELVDHLFRRSAGRMTATLARVLGPAHLDLAEEVVQEALMTALAQWPYAGVPANPAGWLFQVARNRALDHLRRDARFHDKECEIVNAFARRSASPALFEDDDLQMMLLACDERIAPESRLALTLKTVCGFSVSEIARALLAQPATIAQRLVRVKRFIREKEIEFEMPSRVHGRLDSLLDVIYLMFNEGYASNSGDDLIRGDLVDEAVRLAEELAGHPATSLPKAHALAALMHLQRARIPARVDVAGDLMLLDDQDRSLWDREAIARGMQHLDLAASGDELTRFHVEAAIAAEHVLEETNWQRIVELYDDLISIAPSPVVALNRAIAVAMIEGPSAGLALALPLESELRDYVPLHAAIGELSLRAGDHEQAREYFRRAADLATALPLKRWLGRRMVSARSSRG
jgi:RNA polymerase sigma-70 factor (ECF subfamily)